MTTDAGPDLVCMIQLFIPAATATYCFPSTMYVTTPPPNWTATDVGTEQDFSRSRIEHKEIALQVGREDKTAGSRCDARHEGKRTLIFPDNFSAVSVNCRKPT